MSLGRRLLARPTKQPLSAASALCAWRGSQNTAAHAAARNATATSSAWSDAPTNATGPWPLPTRSNRTVPTAAIPTDMASCWIDSSSPEAEPISCGATPARITSNIGTNTMPMPKPVIVSGPARSHAVRLPPSERITRSATMSPAAMTTMPMCIVCRPIFGSSVEEVIEPPMAASGIASVATAQASGVNPRPVWNITLSAIIMPPIAPMKPSTTARPAT